MSEKDFFRWLFIVARNQYYSRIRQLNRLGNNGMSQDDKRVEDLDLAAPDAGQDGKYFLKRFLSFIKDYPEGRQRVLKLWLRSYSYREVEKELKETPFACSHVTVGNWVTASLDAFRKSLGVELAEPTAKISGTRVQQVGVPRLHQPIAGR